MLLCPHFRHAVEPLLTRAAEDGRHQPGPPDAHRRDHNPALGLEEGLCGGLQAAERRMDHRLQEHVRVSEVRPSAPVVC